MPRSDGKVLMKRTFVPVDEDLSPDAVQTPLRGAIPLDSFSPLSPDEKPRKKGFFRGMFRFGKNRKTIPEPGGSKHSMEAERRRLFVEEQKKALLPNQSSSANQGPPSHRVLHPTHWERVSNFDPGSKRIQIQIREFELSNQNPEPTGKKSGILRFSRKERPVRPDMTPLFSRRLK